MELRDLGKTGIRCSLIGLGTVKFGRNDGVKYPQGFDLPDDNMIKRLLSEAQELGINLLDTAPAYGRSETRLGDLLPQKNNWIIVGKAGETFVNGESHFDFSGPAIRKSVDASLAKLGRDYLDVLLIHSNGEDIQILEETDAIEVLHRLKDEGKIRAHGMSSKTNAGGILALENLDVAMVTLNRGDQSQLPVIGAAQHLERGILIKKALDSGHLDPTEPDPAGSALRAIAAIAGVSSIVVGTINANHLQQNCNAVI